MADRRDWANLPSGLLHEIADRLPELTEYFRFWCVCLSWYSFIRSSAILSADLPWLACPISSAHELICLANKRIYKVPRYILEPPPMSTLQLETDGRIFVVDTLYGFLLLNPITGSSIRVPASVSIPYWALYGKGKLYGFLLLVLGFNRFNTGTLWVGNTKVDEYYSVTISIPESSRECIHEHDFILWNGEIIFFNCTARAIWVYNLRSFQKVREIPLLLSFLRGYLVESLSGELLLVLKTERKKFIVLRLDETKDTWVEIHNIGNAILLVDNRQAICYAASDFKRCRSNCIYFTQEYGVKVFDLNLNQCDEGLLFLAGRDWQSTRWFIPRL